MAEQYADLLSLDYRGRSTLLNSFHHNFDHLLVWDHRMQAYVEGLQRLDKTVHGYFREQLTSSLSQGDVFALSIFALVTGHQDLLDGCLRLTQALPALLPVIAQCFEWAPTHSALWAVVSAYPALRVMAYYTRQNIVSNPLLTDEEITVLLPNAAVTPALVWSLYQQQHPDYFSVIQTLSASNQPRLQLGMLTAILTRHLPYEGIFPDVLLAELTRSGNEEISYQAAKLYLLSTHYSQEEYIGFIKERTENTRLYIQSLGIAGNAEAVDILQGYFDIPDFARLSAAAISTITGYSPESVDWSGESLKHSEATPSNPEETLPDIDPDISLSWPDKRVFDHWWANYSYKFEPGHVYLGGELDSCSGMSAVLWQGRMALRPLAIARLQRRTQSFLFPHTAPAFTQHTQMKKLKNREI
ncbi:hypothetical protein ACILPN_07005 [Yersinia wautersii]